MTIADSANMPQTRGMMVPLSVEQYHKMMEAGILEEGAPIELLDGFLFRKDRSTAGADPMTVGTSHLNVVTRLNWLLGGAREGWHFRVQLPITILPDSEPEPDGAILRGTPYDYVDRAVPSDVSCLIEVSDSSLQHDRVTKQRIYADAGIAQYVIVNLIDGAIEIYSVPELGSGRYGKTDAFGRGQTIRLALPGGESLELKVDQVLP